MKQIPSQYREAIYAATIIVLAVVFTLKLTTPEAITQTAEQVVNAISAAVALLALFNVTPD